MPQRTCDEDGCERQHLARGLCSLHWKRKHGKRTKYPRTCDMCSAEFLSSRPDGRFCGDGCKGLAYQVERRTRSRELVHVGPSWPVTWLPKRHPAIRGQKPTKVHVWYAGRCAWCETNFLDWQPAARYCSRKCSRQAGESRRGRFVIPLSRRIAVYERDRWICQLCLGPVDRDLMITNPCDDWAPSLDHIECRSWSDEPNDSADNLRLAHRWCNAVRGDERHYSELDLRIS